MRTYTWLLERPVAPYYFVMDMSLFPVSLSSLWSSVKMTVKDRPSGSILIMSTLMYCVAYTLSFASIWSAATSYFRPSIPTFIMPDRDWVDINSNTLRICWVWDQQRTAGTALDAHKGLVLGFPFGTLFRSFAENQLSEWSRYNPVEYGCRRRDC